jgi:microcystin-dependent protein
MDTAWYRFLGDLWRRTGGPVGGLVVPVGGTITFPGTTAPDGFLRCNGQAVSRTNFADLFDLIGTTYGTGDGSTTFNLPDITAVSPASGADFEYYIKF